jgi:hypothetical protein
MRKVNGIKAVGTTILIEMLSIQEDAGSMLAQVGKPKQGRIVDIGPAMVEGNKYGFAKGDRVLLQGTFTPVPRFPGGDTRDLVVVDPHMIKCVFTEEEEAKECIKVIACPCPQATCSSEKKKGKKKSNILTV